MFIVKLLKKIFHAKSKPIRYEKTLHTRKDMKTYINSVKHTTTKAEMLFRANHGGGCPAPKAIVTWKWWNIFTENL